MDSIRLARGEDYITESGIRIKHPRITDIEQIGVEAFYRFIDVFCSTATDKIMELWQADIDYRLVDNYSLFTLMYRSLYKDDSIRQEIVDACEMFFPDFGAIHILDIGDSRSVMYFSKDGREYKTIRAIDIAYRCNKISILNEKMYQEISDFLNLIVHFNHKPERKFKSKSMMNRILQFEYEELLYEQKHRKPTQTDDFAKLISNIVWGNTNGTNWDNIWNLTLWQFYDGLICLNKKENYQYTMQGIYSGNIDGKKIDLNKIDWKK